MAQTTTVEEMPVASSSTPAIFARLKFWVGHQVPQRSHLINKMRQHGAVIVATEKEADMCLTDHLKKFNLYLEGDFFSYKYAEESLRENVLQPAGRYKVKKDPPAKSSVSSVKHTGKRTRTPFTPQDDQILRDYLIPAMNTGKPWRGNGIYKTIEARYSHHTFQSWRSRFLDHVQYHIPAVEPVQSTPAEDRDQTNNGSASRSPKRRRLNSLEDIRSTSHAHPPRLTAPTSIPHTAPQQPSRPVPTTQSSPDTNLSHDQRPRVQQDTTRATASDSSENGDRAHYPHLWRSLEADPRLKLSIVNRKFTLYQADRLYLAAPHICDTPTSRLEGAWQEMATDYDTPPMHPAQEWKDLFSEVILPAYMKANGLVSTEDLKRHIRIVKSRGIRESTPEIKQEPVDTIRTPEDVQRERELERARKEAEVLMSSDEDEGMDDHSPKIKKEDEGLSSSATDRLGESCLFYPSLPPVPDVEVMESNTIVSNDESNSVTEAKRQPKSPIQPHNSTPKKRLFGQLLPKEASKKLLTISETADHISVPREKIESMTAHDSFSSVTDSTRETSTTDPQAQSQSLMSKQSSMIQSPVRQSNFTDGNEAEAEANLQSSHPSNHHQETEELPEADQRLTERFATSQSSTQSTQLPYRDASQASQSRPLRPSTPELQLESTKSKDTRSLDTRIDGKLINLIEEDEDTNDDSSDRAVSDTGSEYMAFDEEPERSQLWSTPFEEMDHKQENQDPKHNSDMAQLADVNDEESDHEPFKPAQVLEEKPVLARVQDEQTRKVEASNTKLQVAHGLETQDLFEQPLPAIPPNLDVPPPEGGWDDLQIDESEYEEFNTVLETTESPAQIARGDKLYQSQSARKPHWSPLNELRSSSSISSPANRSITRKQQHKAIIDISSDSEDEADIVSPSSISINQKTSGWTSKHASSITVESDTSDSSDSEDSSQSKRSQNMDLQLWFSTQRTRHAILPNAVFHRLASTAAQVTTLNLSTAALILQIMIMKFIEREDFRREQCRATNTVFRPKQNLTEKEAKRFVPTDTWGVWTVADDKALLSRTEAGVRAVEARHGVDGTYKRSRFLRARYTAPDPAVGGIGKEVARQAMLDRRVDSGFRGSRDMLL